MSLLNRGLERCEILILESPIGQRMLAAYRRLPDHEQRLVWIIGSLGSALVLILALVLPTAHYALDSMRAYQRANGDYHWLLSHRQEALRASAAKRAAAQRGDLRQALVATAQVHGLVLERVEMVAGQRVQVALNKAVFTDLTDWLQALRADHYLFVTHIEVQRSGTGRVNARVDITE